MKKKELIDFYDDFSGHQQKVALNDRHMLLFRKLKELGMNTRSKVLELGCGIGTISSLIAREVQQGKICSVDISPKSIDVAKKIYGKYPIDFIAKDILEFRSQEKWDYVTLFDVLEHVPADLHAQLFLNIAEYISDDGILLIHIPSPESIIHDRKHFPERLQIIDQALPANELIGKAYAAGFQLQFFHHHHIWVDHDYQLMAFRKSTPYQMITTASQRSLFQKIAYRLRVMRDRMKYS